MFSSLKLSICASIAALAVAGIFGLWLWGHNGWSAADKAASELARVQTELLAAQLEVKQKDAGIEARNVAAKKGAELLDQHVARVKRLENIVSSAKCIDPATKAGVMDKEGDNAVMDYLDGLGTTAK